MYYTKIQTLFNNLFFDYKSGLNNLSYFSANIEN